ncbi:DUF6207 family protein [Streptomyces sp. NBC_01764]|uniref:DUF6207 family protein n=1 Tax=Streptomyces sp. NBC_01764 TaxID=2975935 RepID=UPI00225556EA|nr:DUF6207 family protein [Streptomyces sp. NBC_01764]MCX4404362.1 DUF6207 family protein [Streptomyces sp. NBC_01764]
MGQIHDAHVAVAGLAVVEVAAADDETAFAVQELLAARCAILACPWTANPVVRCRLTCGD